jgi:hypothetical protein
MDVTREPSVSRSGRGERQRDVKTMDVSAYESNRPRLVAIATRILGSAAETEDVVQEALLRLSRADGVDDPPAWLTTVVRLAPPSFDGAAAVAARFDGAQGAARATIDDELGAAWVVGGTVKVAFAFHVEAGLVREIELIADPEVLATMTVVPVQGT